MIVAETRPKRSLTREHRFKISQSVSATWARKRGLLSDVRKAEAKKAINEALEAECKGIPPRDALIALPQLAERYLMRKLGRWGTNLGVLLAYGTTSYSRGRTKTPMDTDKHAALWKDNIARLCMSHSKEGRDRADFESDQLIGPLLTAPVAQLREFATKLASGLETDERIPWIIWSTFQNYIKDILKREDKGVIELKTEMARQIAEMAESGIGREDWITAMANALQWRSPKALEEVKANLEKGAKPKLTGRESCLFLEVGEAMVML